MCICRMMKFLGTVLRLISGFVNEASGPGRLHFYLGISTLCYHEKGNANTQDKIKTKIWNSFITIIR